MKKILGMTAVLALCGTLVVANAQEQPKAEKAKDKASCCASKASKAQSTSSDTHGDVMTVSDKAGCGSDAKAMKASDKKSCSHDAKVMKASNKEGKDACCSTGAKAMKASHKENCDMSKEECDKSECSDDCKMAHAKTDSKSTNKN